MRILAIAGSLRHESYNRSLLREIAERASEGVEIELWDGLKAVPPYDEDDDTDSPPPGVDELREAIASADGLLFATPEYNASIPGVLKNAVDWASRPSDSPSLEGKPALVVGASTGMFGAVWAQAELRKALKTARARPLEAELPVARAHEAFDERGRLRDDNVAERAAELLDELVAAVHEREPVAA